jgi:hypothetical protein
MGKIEKVSFPPKGINNPNKFVCNTLGKYNSNEETRTRKVDHLSLVAWFSGDTN